MLGEKERLETFMDQVCKNPIKAYRYALDLDLEIINHKEIQRMNKFPVSFIKSITDFLENLKKFLQNEFLKKIDLGSHKEIPFLYTRTGIYSTKKEYEEEIDRIFSLMRATHNKWGEAINKEQLGMEGFEKGYSNIDNFSKKLWNVILRQGIKTDKKHRYEVLKKIIIDEFLPEKKKYLAIIRLENFSSKELPLDIGEYHICNEEQLKEKISKDIGEIEILEEGFEITGLQEAKKEGESKEIFISGIYMIFKFQAFSNQNKSRIAKSIANTLIGEILLIYETLTKPISFSHIYIYEIAENKYKMYETITPVHFQLELVKQEGHRFNIEYFFKSKTLFEDFFTSIFLYTFGNSPEFINRIKKSLMVIKIARSTDNIALAFTLFYISIEILLVSEEYRLTKQFNNRLSSIGIKITKEDSNLYSIFNENEFSRLRAKFVHKGRQEDILKGDLEKIHIITYYVVKYAIEKFSEGISYDQFIDELDPNNYNEYLTREKIKKRWKKAKKLGLEEDSLLDFLIK